MSFRFEAVVDPPAALIDSVGETTPRSPFNTREFAASARMQGSQPSVVALLDGDRLTGGAVALLSGGAWNRRLTIPTAPVLPEPDLFWSGVAQFCRGLGVSDLMVETYASTGSDLIDPSAPNGTKGRDRRGLGDPLTRRRRVEYVLDLKTDFVSTLSTNHRRSVQRARNAAIVATRSLSADGTAAHLLAMKGSVTRRRQRGEVIAFSEDDALHRSLLESGAAELFQAMMGGEVLASILVLRSQTCAYYQSAGTTPEGMRHGASPFLVLETAMLLAADGVRWFNLGGADPEAAGLRRFKGGFGAQEVQLESASYSMIPAYGRALRRLARLVRNGPPQVLSRLTRSVRQAGTRKPS